MKSDVEQIPVASFKPTSKYGKMVSQIETLEPGMSLKVTCDSYEEVRRVRHGIVYDNKERKSGSDVGIQSYREGNVIWFWIKKEATNGAG